MLLRTSGLTKRFGGLTAVDDVEFGLAGDELCSLIGPNGAGKTTFFDLLTGVLDPTEGTVEYREDGTWIDVTDDDPHRTALRGVHRSYQITNLFSTSTVLENVRVAARAHGGRDGWKLHRNVNGFEAYLEEAYDVLERVDLVDHAEEPAETLSHGQKRTLEVAIALAGDPDVLLLDEPTAGVSSDGIDRVVDLIDDVATDHAVLLVEHNMDVVRGSATGSRFSTGANSSPTTTPPRYARTKPSRRRTSAATGGATTRRRSPTTPREGCRREPPASRPEVAR